MITDDDAALKAVETGSRNDPNVYGLWLDQESSPTSEPVDDLQARPSKSSSITDEPQEVARSSRQEVDTNDLGEAAVEEQMEESDMIEVVTSLGATAKAVAPPQPSRRFIFRSTGPSSAATTAKAAAEASAAAAAAAAEAASTGSVTARPSQGSRARTHTDWVSELARRSRRD